MGLRTKTWCLVLVVANVLLIALLSRSSVLSSTNSSQGDADDSGSCNEAIQVAQEAAREYLDAQQESVVIDDDVAATIFKQTRIWTVKGFAGSQVNSRSFRWLVILIYHPSGGWESRWEIVTAVATPLEMETRRRPRKTEPSGYGD